MANEYILVVDDDDSIATILSEILTFEGFQVQIAPDGKSALALAKRDTPRLILLDMRLPDISGWEVAAKLRRRGVMSPIVVMTASQNASACAAEVGANGFLAKPFDVQHLLDVVGQAMGAPV